MNRNRFVMPCLLVIGVGGIATSALGWPDPAFTDGFPRVWCWNEPLGDAASDARYAHTVEANVYWVNCGDPACCDRRPEVLADIACDLIESRGLTEGQVGVRLAGVGWGNLPPESPIQFTCGGGCGVTPSYCRIPALLAHEDDDMTFTFSSTPYTYPTPWVWDGIDECGAWMDDFITAYLAHQSLSGIPDPNRFLFDQEFPWWLTAAPGTSIQFAVAYWTALKADPRWDDGTAEDVPGFAPGKTMDDIWKDAGQPELTEPMSWDFGVFGGSAGNEAWFTWWRNLMLQIQENAMELAVYDRITAEWSICKTSDYYASSKLDGVGDNVYVDGSYESAVGRRLWWEGRADLQQPVLYPLVSSYMFDTHALTSDTCTDFNWSPHEPVTEAAMRILRFNMDACVFSFGGANAWDIMPILTLPHEPFVISGPSISSIPYPAGVDCRMSNDAIRRTIALAKSRGCREIFVWNTLHNDTTLSPQNAYNWTRFHEMLDQVWLFDVDTASIYAGTGTPDAPALYYAEGYTQDVTAHATNGAGVEAVFLNNYGQTSHLRVNIELSAVTNATVRAYIRKNDNSDVAIDLDPVGGGTGVANCSGERIRLTGRIATASNFYHTLDKVKVRVLVEGDSSGYKATFDLIQVCADDNVGRQKADFNGDGTVDSADNSDFSALYTDATDGTPWFNPAVDFNRDGVINSSDSTAWSTCYGNPGSCGYVDEVFPHNP